MIIQPSKNIYKFSFFIYFKKGSMKKKRLRGYFALLVFSLILFVILSSFAGALINVTSPRNYTNYSNWVLFNVSYTNGTDFTDATNATFYYNLSGVWVVIRNASVCHAPVGGGLHPVMLICQFRI